MLGLAGTHLGLFIYGDLKNRSGYVEFSGS